MGTLVLSGVCNVCARCRSLNVAVDSTVPYVERCVRRARHSGEHECRHGFHWKKGLKGLKWEPMYDPLPQTGLRR